MSVRRLDPVQPEDFEFTPENYAWAQEQVAKYPEGKQASAVIPLLWRAQEQVGGWLPEPALRYVASLLSMAQIRVLEVATFYTMFNLSPVGKYFIQLCGTTPCWLRGADDLKQVCREVIGPQGRVSEDGLFSWLEVECLGACTNAPMVQINKYYYEDLTAENFRQVLADLKDGKEVTPGPQINRQFSCPASGPTTLLNMAERAKRSNGASASAAAPVEVVHEDVGVRPAGLSAAEESGADDLKRISGVGPKLEETLNGLGIFHFHQIASWSEENIDWVDDYLSFKGRIQREDWIGQARALAEGRETEFSARYDDGEEGEA